MASSRHGNTPNKGIPVTRGSGTPYTTSVDANNSNSNCRRRVWLPALADAVGKAATAELAKSKKPAKPSGTRRARIRRSASGTPSDLNVRVMGQKLQS